MLAILLFECSSVYPGKARRKETGRALLYTNRDFVVYSILQSIRFHVFTQYASARWAIFLPFLFIEESLDYCGVHKCNFF